MAYPSEYMQPNNPYGKVGAYDAAQPYLQQAQSAAMPSVQSLDKASARLRSRIDTAQRGREGQIRDTYGARGQTFSGDLDRTLRESADRSMNEYAGGLTDLELGYMDKQQQGAQILSQLGQTASGAAKDQSSLALDEELGKGKLNLGRDELNLDKKKAFAQYLLDTFTTMGAIGNADVPDSVTYKSALLKLLGLPGGGVNFENQDFFNLFDTGY